MFEVRSAKRVGVPIVTLREIRGLNEVVGGEEAGDYRVVEPPVHVDDVQVGVVFVSGEAACLRASCVLLVIVTLHHSRFFITYSTRLYSLGSSLIFWTEPRKKINHTNTIYSSH